MTRSRFRLLSVVIILAMVLTTTLATAAVLTFIHSGWKWVLDAALLIAINYVGGFYLGRLHERTWRQAPPTSR